MKYDFKKQIRSFGYAWKGIRQCIGKEQNLSFHLITTIIVIGAGFLFDITRTEWMIIILCIGVVVAAELFNTAIERLVDLVSPERHPIAGQSKRYCRRCSAGMLLLRRQSLEGLFLSHICFDTGLSHSSSLIIGTCQ